MLKATQFLSIETAGFLRECLSIETAGSIREFLRLKEILEMSNIEEQISVVYKVIEL